MLQKLRERMGREEGFTLVELLVVMLIIGILAAIAIPSFLSQKDKAHDASTKSEAKSAQTALETYATDNNGSYAGATSAGLHGIEPTIVTADITLSNLSANGYTVMATTPNTNPAQTFSITRVAAGANAGQTTFACTVAGVGGCPTGGNHW
jgi:type IV pilus assembly protein PilA